MLPPSRVRSPVAPMTIAEGAGYGGRAALNSELAAIDSKCSLKRIIAG